MYNKKSHVLESERLYKRYLKGRFGKRVLSTLTRKEIQDFHGELGESVGQTAANRAVELMSVVINKAIDWDLFDGRNPATRIKKYYLKSRKRFLTPSEATRFFQAISTFRGTDGADLALLALLTGARSGNLRRMQWQELNLEEGIWHIPESKNGDDYDIPLVPLAIDTLNRRKAAAIHSKSKYVFPAVGSSKKGHIENPRKTFKQILDSAGIENFRFHDLRRSLGSWLAMTGSSLVVIGRALNHRDPKSTMIYAQLDLNPVRHAMDAAIESLLSSADPCVSAEFSVQGSPEGPKQFLRLVRPLSARARYLRFEERIAILRDSFGLREFSVSEAQTALALGDSQTRLLLEQMLRRGRVVKMKTERMKTLNRKVQLYMLSECTEAARAE